MVEAGPTPGGAVASASDVAAGFVHDTFSSFYPLAAASPVLQSMRLERFGLTWAQAPAVVGTPLPDGDWSLLHRKVEDTAAGLERQHAGDGEAWLDLYDLWLSTGDALLRALLSPFPPVRAGVRLAAKVRAAGGLSLVRMLLESADSLTRSRFGGVAGQLLVAGNSAHSDLHPAAAGSGFFGWMLSMLGQQKGFLVPVGGAGKLSEALVKRLEASGGSLRCEAEATRVLVHQGRATGVRLADGEVVRVRRAVVADVSAPALYGRLLNPADVPPRALRSMSAFQWDPATVKVDWALRGPVPWIGTPERAPGTVHLFRSPADLSIALDQIADGFVPERPFLVVGQMTTADPSRSPAGTEALWAYTHVPQTIRGDAGGLPGAPITGAWDRDDAERMADRMQAMLEQQAPGFGSAVIARRILTPRDLERRNANLVGGALAGGTSALHQQLVFRPIPGRARSETPIAGLFLGSASAHPGGGVHGACGANAARAAINADRRLWGRSSR